MTENEYTSAVLRAIAKRDRIIEREGDGNGERLDPEYLELLIAEELRAEEAGLRFCGKALCSA